MGQRYEVGGAGYARARRAEPRIAALLCDALGDARTVLNVGAGTGNYEPADRRVIAAEPFKTMLAQRPAGTAAAVQATAEALPFADRTFDAALAIFTVHHWSDPATGLTEMRRVARRQVILMNKPGAGQRYWLADYLPSALSMIGGFFAAVQTHLDVQAVIPVPIPADCVDGFLESHWLRPEAFLDPSVQGAMSRFVGLSPAERSGGIERLAHDLESGAWEARYGHLRQLSEYDLGLRIVVAGGS